MNCKEIATQLHRTPGELCKFFGCELATQSRITDDRAIINGQHTNKILQQHLDTFIDKFVLCPTCLLPETKLSVKSGNIYHKCKACGSKNLVDMSHKLCKFILSQHKAAKKDSKGDKKDKKLREREEGEKRKRRKRRKKKRKRRRNRRKRRRKRRKRSRRRKRPLPRPHPRTIPTYQMLQATKRMVLMVVQVAMISRLRNLPLRLWILSSKVLQLT